MRERKKEREEEIEYFLSVISVNREFLVRISVGVVTSER